jgi:hypothetical protein
MKSIFLGATDVTMILLKKKWLMRMGYYIVKVVFVFYLREEKYEIQR